MPKQTIYNAGIYVRLSKDDERAGESLSIENQKRILTSYVTEQGWNIVDIYVDDGFSGTNFDRPGVTRLLEDAKTGKLNLNQMNSYSEFISYANEKRNEYIKVEKEYFIKVGTLDANWIVSEFTKSNSGGLFKKNTIVQQLYDCLSFVAYLDFLENIK